MKKGSKRFFALFLAAAMAVTPLSYANAEGEDGSQLTDMSGESGAKNSELAVSYENIDEPEKVQKTKETEREVKESEQEVKETGQESKETEQEVKKSEQESKETEQETKETEQEVKETEPEAKETEPEVKETVEETSESGTEEQKSATPSEIVKEAEQLLGQNSENEIELLFVNIGDQTYEDGKYDIAIESSYGMFKIAKSTAEVKGEKIIVTIETSSATYDRIYIGSKDDADKTPVITGKVNDLGGYTFVVELSADKMGKNITFVPCKKDTEDGWYVKKDVYFTVPEVMTKTDTSSEGKDPSEDDGSSEEDKQTIAKDGEYADVSVESNSSMFKIVRCVLTSKAGKMTAVITLSGTGYDKLYMGTAADAAKADASEVITYMEDADSNYTFTVPVTSLDQPIAVAAHSVKKDVWYDRTLTFKSDNIDIKDNEGTDKEPDGEDSKDENNKEPESTIDNKTSFKDGSYTADAFEFSGGTGKTKITCEGIAVVNGKSYAKIMFSSKNYTKLMVGDTLYDAISNETGSLFYVPVHLNKDTDVVGTTVAMGTEKEIKYVLKITLNEKEPENPEEPEDPKKPENPEDPKEPENPKEPTNPEDPKEPENPEEIGKLSDGDYKINVESSASMFKVTKCILSLKDGKMSAIITLSGTGYDYLYMGTADEAAAAADSAKIPFVTDSDGKYTYAVYVNALDTPIAVAAHSIKNDQWYDRMLTFKSAGMTKIESGENEGSGDDYKEPDNKGPENTGDDHKSENDNKEDSESKYESDTSGSTGKVDSSTALKDGVYTPDKFSWSGGTGKVSISCSKVTIKNGQAYATIVFSSSSYGYVKASGNTYYPTRNGDTSVFTIPVALNKNNRIIGMTTKMSANHEIEYSIYVYLAAADQGSNNAAGDLGSKDALDEEAPAIAGLDFVEEEKIEYAKYFKIYHYENDITLLEIDMRKDTGLNEDKDDDSEDEDESLYDGNVVKYLVVPEDEEIPAGLDKEVIVVRTPVENAYVASEEVLRMLDKADSLGKVASVGFELKDVTDENIKKILKDENLIYAGTFDDIDYKKLLESQCKIAVMPYDLLPKEDADEETIKECRAVFEDLTQRLELLEIPVIVDRSESEKEDLAKAEWIKIYGTLFGFEKEAADLFDEAVNEANN